MKGILMILVGVVCASYGHPVVAGFLFVLGILELIG